MEKVYKYGEMVPYMKDFGKMIKLVVKADLYMQMGIFMKEIGWSINRMVMACIFIRTELGMKASGKMIYNMEKVILIKFLQKLHVNKIIILGIETWPDSAKYEGYY